MTDQVNKSVQKGQVVKVTHQNKGESNHKVAITYKRLDGPKAGTELTRAAFASQLNDNDKALLKQLEAGSVKEFVITNTRSTYKDKQTGETRNVWNLAGVADVSTWTEKPQSTYQGKSSGGAGGSGGGWGKDSPSAKVGGLMHDAAALIAATLDKNDSWTVENLTTKMGALVRALARESYAIEQEIQEGNFKPGTEAAKPATQAAAKTTTKDNVPWDNSAVAEEEPPMTLNDLDW